jgi:hypothetical protein
MIPEITLPTPQMTQVHAKIAMIIEFPREIGGSPEIRTRSPPVKSRVH